MHDPQVVISELQRLHGLGVPLNLGSMVGKDHSYLVSAGGRLFGSYALALQAAGLDYRKIRRNESWTKMKVIRRIRALERRGVRLSCASLKSEYGQAIMGAGINLFGSWSEAVEAAGISYQRHCRVFSTKAWLRRLHQEKYQAALSSSRKHALTRRRIKK